MTDKNLSKYVTLVSNDGFEFQVLRDAACISPTIKKALDPDYGFKEGSSGRVKFENINGVLLEEISKYLYYHLKYKDSKDVPDPDIPAELCLELAVVSDYLDV